MTDTNPAPEQPVSSGLIFRVIAESIAAGIDAGLPAPTAVRVYRDSLSIDITLGSITDRLAWQPIFGIADAVPHEQPWPLDVPPEQFQKWTTVVWAGWNGWMVTLRGEDPITDEHRRLWVETGRAAQRAEYLAREAAQRGDQA